MQPTNKFGTSVLCLIPFVLVASLLLNVGNTASAQTKKFKPNHQDPHIKSLEVSFNKKRLRIVIFLRPKKGVKFYDASFRIDSNRTKTKPDFAAENAGGGYLSAPEDYPSWGERPCLGLKNELLRKPRRVRMEIPRACLYDQVTYKLPTKVRIRAHVVASPVKGHPYGQSGHTPSRNQSKWHKWVRVGK